MERRLLWYVTGKQRRAEEGPPKRVSFRASNRNVKRETKEVREMLAGTNRSAEVRA